MRAATCFMVGVLVCTGCFTAAPPIALKPGAKVEDLAKAPPPVVPERVSDENYRTMAQALEDELDRADRQNRANKTPE